MKLIVKIKEANSAYAYCVYSVDDITNDIFSEGTRIFASDDKDKFLEFMGGSIHQILEAWDKAVENIQ